MFWHAAQGASAQLILRGLFAKRMRMQLCLTSAQERFKILQLN
jgi:hypothetical protein